MARTNYYIASKIALNIRYFMEREGLSAKALAEAAGINYVQLLSYINKKNPTLPSDEVLDKLAQPLNCTVDDILEALGRGDYPPAGSGPGRCEGLGERLRAIRGSRTFRQMEGLTEVSAHQWEMYEKRVSEPSNEVVRQIAQRLSALGEACSVRDILGFGSEQAGRLSPDAIDLQNALARIKELEQRNHNLTDELILAYREIRKLRRKLES